MHEFQRTYCPISFDLFGEMYLMFYGRRHNLLLMQVDLLWNLESSQYEESSIYPGNHNGNIDGSLLYAKNEYGIEGELLKGYLF